MSQDDSATWSTAVLARMEFAKTCHANLQDMVRLADAKAAAVLAIHAVLVALLGSNLLDRVRDSAHTVGWKGVASVALLSLLLTLASLLAAILVLTPRTKIREHVHPPRKAALLVWIDDLDRFQGEPDRYASAINATGPDELLGDLAYENLKIAWLLKEKFRWLPRSLWLLVAAVAGWLLTLIWSVVA